MSYKRDAAVMAEDVGKLRHRLSQLAFAYRVKPPKPEPGALKYEEVLDRTVECRKLAFDLEEKLYLLSEELPK